MKQDEHVLFEGKKSRNQRERGKCTNVDICARPLPMLIERTNEYQQQMRRIVILIIILHLEMLNRSWLEFWSHIHGHLIQAKLRGFHVSTTTKTTTSLRSFQFSDWGVMWKKCALVNVISSRLSTQSIMGPNKGNYIFLHILLSPKFENIGLEMNSSDQIVVQEF